MEKSNKKSVGLSKRRIAAIVVVISMAAMAFFVMQAIGNGVPDSYIVVGDPKYPENVPMPTYVNTSTHIYIYGTAAPNADWEIHYRIFVPGCGWGTWKVTPDVADFTFGGECTHYVEYYAVDEFGNNESAIQGGPNNQTFHVDESPPTTTIEFGAPQYVNVNTYITSNTLIYINATDYPVGDCASGVKYIEYRIQYNGQWSDWTIYTGPFSLRDIGDTNDCQHKIQARSIDNLGNIGSKKTKTVYVDNTPPRVDKTIFDPLKKIGEDEYYVTSDTRIRIRVTDDQGPTGCNVGSVHLNGTIEYQGQIKWIDEFKDSGTLTKNIYLEGNCTHILKFKVWDDLGNVWPSDGWDKEIFHVDNIPPETSKDHDGTFIHHYDPANESIYLDMERDPLNPIPYDPFPYPGQWELHELYPEYCNLYWIEEWADNCDGVLSPCDTIVLWDTASQQKATYHVEDVTITLYINNPDPSDPSNDMYIEFLGGFNNIQSGMTDPNGTAWHQIRPTQGFCTQYMLDDWKDNDKDGKLSNGDNINLTDPTGREVKWTIGAPVKTDVIVTPEFDWEKYCSNIILTARDPGECAVDNVSIYWGWEDKYGNWYPKAGSEEPQQGDPGYGYCGNYNWTYFPEYGRWFYNYTHPIHFHEECVHILKYFSEDEFGNREKIKIQEYRVDKTAPWHKKIVKDPKYEREDGKVFINRSTRIILKAEDRLGECNVSSVKLHYRVYSNATKTWKHYNFTSQKWEEGWGTAYVDSGLLKLVLHLNDTECKHYLEYWVEDDLGNRDPEQGVDNETFYVDNTPPLENKTVGKPSMQLDEDVWRINKTTKIWINATDAGKCASGVLSITYRVWALGKWWPWHDYSGPFQLTAECNKTLQVNVTDNLGNSKIYTEYFYVDNTPPKSYYIIGEPHWPPTEISSGNISVNTPIYLHGSDTGCKPRWKIRYNITNNKNGQQVYPVGAPYDEGNWFEVINFTFSKLGLGPGNYTLKYWAFDGVNEEDEPYHVFHVVQLPIAEIEYHPNATEKPFLTTADIITFLSKTSNPEDITDYLWDFGDGNSATGQTVTHRFEDPGIYEVKLKAMAFGGWLVGNDTVFISITGAGPGGPGRAPVACFNYTPYPPIMPTIYDDVQFDSSCSYDPDLGDYIIWRYWDWGDGNLTYNETSPTHKYTHAGTYTVTLYVYDSTYLFDSVSRTVTVIDDKNPIASFKYDPLTPIENQVITFTSTSTDPDIGDSIVNWTWDFGDGTIKYGEIVTHSYTTFNESPGYTVTLTVRDNHWAIDTTSKVIKVYGQRTIDIPLAGKNASAFTGYQQSGVNVEGWNLITIPVQNSYTAKTLMEAITASGTVCVQLSRWNATASEYGGYDSLFYDKVHNKYINLGLAPDTPIENGVGYWVYVEDDATFTVTGYPIFNVSVPLDTTGWSKWNLLGWFKLVDTTAEDFAKYITLNDHDFNHSQVSIWNTTKDSFDTYIPNVAITNFPIKTGMGMFVWVPNGDKWEDSQVP